jgi:hypothetical protein
METKELEKEIARLESMNDQLTTELTYIDELLKLSGFSRGIESLREVALEMLEEPPEEDGRGGYEHE